MRVCSRWRLVALNEPRLWTCVQLSDEHISSIPKAMPAVEEVLRRGGRLLRHFSVYERASAKPFLSIITPYLNRVKTLQLDVSSKFIIRLLSLPPALCSLEAITVNISGIEWLSTGHHLFEGAHSLCHFTLGLPRYSAARISTYFALRPRFPWNQLTSLVFEHVSFYPSTLHEVLAQFSRLVTLVAKITILEFITGDAPDTILLPCLESLELSLCGWRPIPLRSLLVPSLSVLSIDAQKWEADDRSLSEVIAYMLHRSSSPLIDLQIYNAIEEDMEPILEHCPRLLYLDAPRFYLELLLKN